MLNRKNIPFLKIATFPLFAMLFNSRIFAQQLILAAKDSTGSYKLRELHLPNLGGSLDAACSIYSVKVYPDSLVVFENKCMMHPENMIKAVYIVKNAAFVLKYNIIGRYMPPKEQKGFYLFDDGTKLID
jgi:hypothetical protein